MNLYNAYYGRFLEYIKGKHLICYGAGKMLDEMSEVFVELPDICASLSLVDGDRKKYGKERELFGRKYVIEALDEALNDEDIVILITSAALVEILITLEKHVNGEIPVFSFLLMRKENYEKELINIEDYPEIIGKKSTEKK